MVIRRCRGVQERGQEAGGGRGGGVSSRHGGLAIIKSVASCGVLFERPPSFSSGSLQYEVDVRRGFVTTVVITAKDVATRATVTIIVSIIT